MIRFYEDNGSYSFLNHMFTNLKYIGAAYRKYLKTEKGQLFLLKKYEIREKETDETMRSPILQWNFHLHA